MAKKDPVIYWRAHYEETDDSFALETSNDGGKSWDMEIRQNCVDGELVNYRFLTTIRKYTKLGFKPYPGKW